MAIDDVPMQHKLEMEPSPDSGGGLQPGAHAEPVGSDGRKPRPVSGQDQNRGRGKTSEGPHPGPETAYPRHIPGPAVGKEMKFVR